MSIFENHYRESKFLLFSEYMEKIPLTEETIITKINETDGDVGFMFIGRTTPPTIGHITVFLQMIELRDAIKRETGRDIPIMLNLSPSSPTNIKTSASEFEDPLSCANKIKYIQSMLGKLGKLDDVHPVCIENGSTNFRGIQLSKFLEGRDLHTIIVFIGRDRFDTEKKTVQELMNSYTIISRRVNIEVFVLDRVKKDKTSGSEMRKIIMTNTEEDAIGLLNEAYTYDGIPLLDVEELRELYNIVREGMDIGEKALSTVKKSKTKRKVSKSKKSRKKRKSKR